MSEVPLYASCPAPPFLASALLSPTKASRYRSISQESEDDVFCYRQNRALTFCQSLKKKEKKTSAESVPPSCLTTVRAGKIRRSSLNKSD